MSKLIRQAFTLIELLVVIAIIGILSGLIVVSMGGMTDKANVAKAQVFSNSLKNSMMLNLVSEWRFDQIDVPAVGKTPDSWSSGNTGTLVGPTHLPVLKSSSDCVSGQCLQFDGTEDYVFISDADSLDVSKDLTVSLWIKRVGDGTGVTPGIIAKRDSNSGWGLMWQSTNTGANISARIYQSDSTAINLDNFNIDNNKWQLITLVADSSIGKVRIYRNGQMQGTEKTYNGTIFAGISPLYIGQQSSAYFNGLIDEVRFFNTAMLLSQIKEQYYAGLNSLLAKGSIDIKDYREKVNSIAQQ